MNNKWWISIWLGLAVLLMAFNTILVRRYCYERACHLKLARRYAQAQATIKQITLRSMGVWQQQMAILPEFEKGLQARQQGHPAQAIQSFSRILQQKPDAPLALYLRGLAYLDNGDTVNALKDFSGYLQQVPTSARVYLLRGRILWQMGQVALARKDFAAALQLQPASPLARKMLTLTAKSLDQEK